MLSSAGVTSRIDRLERRGLVRRLDDPDDRRGVIIELTDEGREVVDEAVAALAISDRQLLERLDPAEVEQLEGLLRKLLGPPGAARVGPLEPADRSAETCHGRTGVWPWHGLPRSGHLRPRTRSGSEGRR